jgi:hypothetical protein
MPKASKASASESVEVEGYEGHIENFEGGYTVAFEKYTQDADLTPRTSEGYPTTNASCGPICGRSTLRRCSCAPPRSGLVVLDA